MYSRAIKNMFQLVAISLLLSACAGSSEEITPTNSKSSTGSEKSVKVVTNPANSQTGVSTTLAMIYVNFLQQVNFDTVTSQSFSISPSISFTLNKAQLLSNGQITLNVNNGLQADTVYNVVISGVQDRNGNALADFSWTFSTSSTGSINPPPGGSDTQAPTSPSNLRVASGSLNTTSVRIQWNASTDNTGVTHYIVSRNGSPVSANLTGLAYTDTGLQASTTYSYTVAAFDAAGNSASSSSLSVTTLSVDNTSPTVTGTTPANGSTLVSPNIAEINVDFSESIDPNSLNGSSFTLNNGATGVISTVNGDTRARFVPSSPLARGTTYTASLNGVTDPAGNPLTGNNGQVYSWSFSTCGDTPASTYTISWDAVSDADLTGYKVYYGTASPLNKSNAMSVTLASNVTSWILNPSAEGFKPCDTVYIAITALGSTKGESAFSNLVNEVID